MPANSLVQDFYALPREERVRVHNLDPGLSAQIRTAIDSDADFRGLSAAEQEKVWVELGYPSQTAMAKPQAAAVPQQPSIGLTPMQPVGSPTLQQFQGGPQPMLETPPTDVTAGAFVRTAPKPGDNLLQQLTQNYRQNIASAYAQPPTTGLLSSPAFRGAMSAVPTVAPFLPKDYNPDLLSVENAARIATETLMTAPLFGGITRAMGGANKVYDFFTRYPGALRFVVDGFVIGGVDVAYRRFLKWTGDRIQNGDLEFGFDFKDFLGDTAKTGAIILGFGGVMHGAVAGARGTANLLSDRLGTNIPTAVPNSFAELGRELRSPARNIFPERERIVSNVAKNWGETIAALPQPASGHPITAWSWPGNVRNRPSGMLGASEIEKRIPPEPRPIFSPTAPGEQAVFPGMQGPSGAVAVGPEAQALAATADPRQLGLNLQPPVARSAPPRRPKTVIGAGEQVRPQFDPQTNTFGIPGERPDRPRTVIGPYPQARQAVDNILTPNKTVITSEGAIEASIAEPVMKAQFTPHEHANSGDWVYIESAGGKSPQVGQVINRFENGVQVKTDRSQFFVPFDRVTGKMEGAQFSVGEEVLHATGEKVVVKGYTPDKRVWIRKGDGTLEVESAENLTNYAKSVSAKEIAERAQKGITEPAPEGTSVFDIFRSEEGAFYPGRLVGKIPGFRKLRQKDIDDEAAGKFIRQTAATQPMDENFGNFANYLDPGVVFSKATGGVTGVDHYIPVVKALYDSRRTESALNHKIEKQIKAFQKIVGRSEEVAARLQRAAVGVLKPGETLTPAEQGVMDSWNQLIQTEFIPRLNQRLAQIGRPPVPANYPYALQTFPDLILAAGQARSSMGAKAMEAAKSIKITGVDNEIMYGATAARLHLEGNFWQLAERTSKFISHEAAWRDTSTLLQQYRRLEVSPAKQKYFDWLMRHIEGDDVSPAIADISSHSHKVDKQIRDHFGVKSVASIELPTETIRLEVPAFSLASANPSNIVAKLKTLSYANTIGFNLRSMMVNFSQPVTHVLPSLPGNPLSNAANTLAGYLKGMGTLFSPRAQEHYRKLGVLHDMEDIFSQQSFTATKTADPLTLKNAMYYGEYLYNAMSAITFLNMRWSEVINRVAGFEMTKSALTDAARRQGMEKLLADPDFIRSIKSYAEYQTNISNFLYGKGFKSPMQESLGIKAGPGATKGIRAFIAPLGEVFYQYNTFASKTIGMTNLHFNQLRGQYGNLAGRIARMDSPAEFGQLLDSMQTSDRFTLLRAIAFQTAAAWAISNLTGLQSMWYQLLPQSQFGIQVKTPLFNAGAKFLEQLSGGNVVGAGGTAFKALVPGYSAVQRAERAGGFDLSKEALLATRSDIEGRRPPYVQPTPLEQIEDILGIGGTERKSPRY